MKVAVCTLAINDWYKEIVKYGLQTIKNYAKRHGYDFYDCEDIYDGERDYPWYKIKAIQKILPDYDYVMWVDCDGHILRPELSIDYFINNYLKDKDLLGAQEFNCSFTTGIMILRNTPFIHSLLQLIWTNTEKFDPNFHEQASLCQIYDSDRLNSRTKIQILPLEQQHVLFVYWANYHVNYSFFFHAARCSHDPPGFVYTLDCYCPIPMDEDVPGEYENRLAWLNDETRCRLDIELCLRSGTRFGTSTRTVLYTEKFIRENLAEKIAKSKLKKNL